MAPSWPRQSLCDENGKLRRFLNVYVNSEDIRWRTSHSFG